MNRLAANPLSLHGSSAEDGDCCPWRPCWRGLPGVVDRGRPPSQSHPFPDDSLRSIGGRDPADRSPDHLPTRRSRIREVPA